ncbi:MAG TPA: ARMT1-like domain-containing protein, partial [Methanomicrobiales archaeon]|nr:ARMT1-like domain-containing protein [Methanomicrobiales archaeon]
YDCLLGRIAYECRLSTADEGRIARVLSGCTGLLEGYRRAPQPAAAVASAAHRRAYELLGDLDPYREVKETSTREAIRACRAVRHTLAGFRDHALASVIANTFDYGVSSHRVTDDFMAFFQGEFARGFLVDDTPRMEELAGEVVYFTDNAGEIIFDRLLVEYLAGKGSRVTVAVKGAPILNDATLGEAEQAGLRRFARVTTTGSGDIGVSLGKVPEDLREALDRCSMVIAKGMANYEALTEYAGLPPVAYLMAVKCPTIAESVGVPEGSLVAMLTE